MQATEMNYIGDLGGRLKYIVAVGHLLMVAPHPLILGLGSLVAGSGWTLMRRRLAAATGVMLAVYGILVEALALLLMLSESSLPLAWTSLVVVVNSPFAVMLALAVLTGICANGLLAASLFKAAESYNSRLFRCAGVSAVFVVALTTFTAIVMLVASTMSLPPDAIPPRGELVASTFTMSVGALITISCLCNAMAGAGFLTAKPPES